MQISWRTTKPSAKGITINETPDQRNEGILFGENAVEDMHESINKTKVGKRLVAKSDEADSGDITRLDWNGNRDIGKP